MGIKPAGAIATSALYKSADKFKDKYPNVSDQVKKESYVDDDLGITAAWDKRELRLKTSQADEILEDAGMEVKRWIYSGEEPDEVQEKLWTN